MQARQSRGPWLWPLALAIVGVVLLLDNFLLLGDFNPTLLWPLLLVIAGAQILLQGDILPVRQAKTFGITRGSVEAGTLDISAGEIDVNVRALRREGRLIRLLIRNLGDLTQNLLYIIRTNRNVNH